MGQKEERIHGDYMTWLDIRDIKPNEDQETWYCFGKSGKVYDGFYSKSEYGDAFYGKHGFIINEVIYWMPIQWSKEKPEVLDESNT
jgi:hypothetical protein